MILKKLKNPIYSLLILTVIALAVFFRTYDYFDRVFILADNSRDIQIARYAADTFQVPPIGQFSSAGPFFYGPWYYWFLEIVSFLPLGILTHWFVITTTYLVFVAIIFWLGKQIGGPITGLLAGLFAAISPAQINSSFSVWNPTIIPFLVAISLVFLIKFSQTQKPRYIFLLSATISLAITIHFQAILTLPILLVALLGNRYPRPQFFKNFLAIAAGLLIPLLPLIYFDAHHHWHNFASLFIYLAIDQFNIYVPNRWLTYVGNYWPNAWSTIVGGHSIVSAAIITLLAVFTLAKLKKFKEYKLFYLVAATFVLEVIAFRYFRGERFQYYSLFAHPSVLLLTAWTTHQLFKFQRVLGLALIVAVFLLTTNLALADLKERSISFKKISSIKTAIYEKYPDQTFDIYGCRSNADSVSHPLALVTYYDGRNHTDGLKIGVCETVDGLVVSRLSEEEVSPRKKLWVNKTTFVVYKTTALWWRENPPQGGPFWSFIKKKLSPKCYPHC